VTINKQKRRDVGRTRTPHQNIQMTNLEYYLHDEADALRIEIAGDLTGAGLSSIEHALRTAKSILAVRPIVVAPTAVAEADDDGRGLLRTWHRCGARIIARSMDSRTLAESILGTSIPMPPAKSGWRQRFSDFLRRCSAAAATFEEISLLSFAISLNADRVITQAAQQIGVVQLTESPSRDSFRPAQHRAAALSFNLSGSNI
jgi:hypothetical protein